jgi:hypothetical protein
VLFFANPLYEICNESQLSINVENLMSKDTKLQSAVRVALGLSAGTLALGVSPGALAQDDASDILVSIARTSWRRALPMSAT